MSVWTRFANEHPKAAEWIREGGLFFLVSNFITVMKYLLLQFLPYAFESWKDVNFGWPGIPMELFGVRFDWNIFGYAVKYDHGQAVVGGGLGYFAAYMIAMIIGETVNFPIQRNFVFRSKGNLGGQIAWYTAAFVVINCIVNSINCAWVAVAGLFVPGWIYNIGTILLNGGVSMVIFFFVNKIIFPQEKESKMSA